MLETLSRRLQAESPNYSGTGKALNPKPQNPYTLSLKSSNSETVNTEQKP